MYTGIFGGILVGIVLLALCGGVVYRSNRSTRALTAEDDFRADGGDRAAGSDGSVGDRSDGSGGSRPRSDGGVATGYGFVTAKPTGLIRWLTTVDHRDIGILYLTFGVFMFLWGLLVISLVDNFLKPFIISRGSHLPFILVFLGVIGGVVANVGYGIAIYALVVALLLLFVGAPGLTG